MCEDMCKNVWGHVQECVRTCARMYVQECVRTCAKMCEDMCNNVWGHVQECLRTHSPIYKDMCENPWGHSNNIWSSCSKCKRRKGRSCFRGRASYQQGTQINALYDIYELNKGRTKLLAGEKLKRWGFNPDRRCLLPLVCDELFIRVPGREDELFPNVDERDKLHGLLTFLHRVLFKSFNHMHLPTKLKLILDQRLTELGLERIMRDPNNGRTFRVQNSVFKETNMSGEDKVHWIFFMPHVLGHRAECLPEQFREPVLTALAHAQLMVIASRGFRSYNITELELIYDKGYILFFAALEKIYELCYHAIYNAKLKKHHKNPKKYPAPKPFKRTDPYVYLCLRLFVYPYVFIRMSLRFMTSILTYLCVRPYYMLH